jgi:hypothetical protein
MKLQRRNDGKFELIMTNKERTALVHRLFEGCNLLGDMGAGANPNGELRRLAKRVAPALAKVLHVVQDPKI